MIEAASISFSPLKLIKVPLVVDNTADFVEPPSGRSPRWPSPSRSERPAWTALPAGSLYPKHNDPTALCVPIPTRLAYRPNLRPPPQVGINPSANYPINYRNDTDTSGRDIIISRHLLIDDSVVFTVGTKSSGTVSRDTKEVPLSRILDHVSLAELQRFENQEFLQEDIREANQPPPKAKGRPVGSRLIDGKLVLSSDRVIPKPQARHDKLAVSQPRTGLTSSPGTPLIAVKVPAFVRLPQVPVMRGTSFSRLQPTKRGPETNQSSETSEDELSSHRPPRRPQYAMVTASRLAPSETSLEGETSREVSASRQPSLEASRSYHSEQSPKRRRLEAELPLRAPSPTRSLISKPTFFDKIFQQPQPAPNLLNIQANRLPSMWPASFPPTVMAHTQQNKSSQSSFPPGFCHKTFTPNSTSSDRAQASAPNGLPTSAACNTVQVSYKNPTQSDYENVEMVDLVEDRDEEAEREALLRQFQPLDSHKAGRPSLQSDVPRPKTPTPPPPPDAVPISAQEASALARDMLNKFHGQSRVPSIQVSTPSKSIPKRSSITPHFPRRARRSSNAFDDSSIRGVRSERSPSKTRPAPVTAAIPPRPFSPKPPLSAGSGQSAPKTEVLTTRANITTHPSPTSRTIRQPTNLAKPSSQNHTKLSLYSATNGSSNKRQHRSPTPNDITKYFRPKSIPAKPPSSRPAPANDGATPTAKTH